MASTTFTNKITSILAEWLNDVDAVVYGNGNSSRGSALLQFIPSGTGAVATTVQTKLRERVSPADFGATPGGVTSATAAIQNTINTGASVIDLCGNIYAIDTKLVFSSADQKIINGELKFTGTTSERIANVTANNVTFDNVVFNANESQPRSGLVWVADNVTRPIFRGCTFKKITAVNNGSTVLNQTYALLISPYGVVNFEVSGCLFQDLLKYNDGVNGTPIVTATEGLGFIGGVCFLPEDMSAPIAAQPVVTQGVISKCVFDNIKTILAGSLSIADQIKFNDADAIRTYGESGGAEQLHVETVDCVFRNVSKRCFKYRASGSTAYNNECYAADLPYRMPSPIDVTSNSRVCGMKIYASSSMPVYTAITWSVGPDTNKETLIDDLYVSHATIGLTYYSDASNSNLSSFTLRGSTFNQVYDGGVLSSSPFANDYEDIVIENCKFWGGSTTTKGIESVGGLTSSSSGLTLRDCFFSNCSINCAGIDNTFENVTQEISSNTWVAATTSTQLCRIGDYNLGGYQKVDGLFINAHNLATTFLDATRATIATLIGDNATFKNIRFKVPQGMSQSFPHMNIYGREVDVDGFAYDGPSYISVGTLLPISRGSIMNAVRMSSNGSATTQPFLYSNNASTTQLTFQNIVDFRDPGGSTKAIDIANGTNIVALNVAANSAVAEVVSTGGVVATLGCTRFATPTQAYAVSNVTSNRTLDANTISAADLADVVGTLLNDLRDRQVIRY